MIGKGAFARDARMLRAAAFSAALLFATAAAADTQAQIQTSLGTITVALDTAHAPQTVANFVRYAREGHFDGTVIYRVVPGFVLQMGSYDAKGNARPMHGGIPLETASGLTNLRGTLSMARTSDPGSATAEFFINLSNNADLDPTAGAPPDTTGYAVFGHVTAGMDVVDKVAAVPLGGATGPFPPEASPLQPVTITKVTVTDTPAAAPPK
jgi:cyclophilin family peptidyl-prolyl cis-trans isomerase